MNEQPTTFKNSDGATLKGTLFAPAKPVASVVIHPATGVPSKYYHAFARWLCNEKQINVLTYAYRDSEDISPADQKRSAVTMADWGIKDQAAALDHLLDEHGELPVHVIGHSLGGFCVPYHRNRDRITSLTAVNSGPANWLHHPWSSLPKVILFWFVVGPVLTWFKGSMPGFLLGMKNDIPSGVYWQWRRWCTNEKFFEIEWGMEIPKPDLQRFTAPLTLISAVDDDFIPPSRVKRLKRYYPSSVSSFVSINPKDHGLASIGHIAIFSKRCQAVWPSLVANI